MFINKFCLSSYLAFRYVAKKSAEWIPGIGPLFPDVNSSHQTPVSTSPEVLSALREEIQSISSFESTGIFLSGGTDSAILAALLPKGTRSYTINFNAKNSANEYEVAKLYAEEYGLEHHVIDIEWSDYERYEVPLMVHKRAPLHAVEVALYKASIQVKSDGIEHIILGNGADSTFGGLDKLLSKDWTFDEFIERYTFIAPQALLERPEDIAEIYQPYRLENNIDYIAFLKYIHGAGIIQAFNNALGFAGITAIEPYEKLIMKAPLDLTRIRSGQPKYILTDIFKQLYPSLLPPEKVPFARPMSEWLAEYPGPTSDVFRTDFDIASFTGDQKYLIRCLDKFIELLGDKQTWL